MVSPEPREIDRFPGEPGYGRIAPGLIASHSFNHFRTIHTETVHEAHDNVLAVLLARHCRC
jgi:hypothetical protein